jgi:hypothetical protein
MSTPNSLAMKWEEDPLPYCKLELDHTASRSDYRMCQNQELCLIFTFSWCCISGNDVYFNEIITNTSTLITVISFVRTFVSPFCWQAWSDIMEVVQLVPCAAGDRASQLQPEWGAVRGVIILHTSCMCLLVSCQEIAWRYVQVLERVVAWGECVYC